jgi:ATP-dependent DNA helicase RecG
MTSEQLKHIIQQGESITVEFKTSKEKLNKDAFDTICAFLNRRGGYLILGVNDKKEITGVDENAVQGILDTLAVNANNPQKLNPPYYLSPEVVEVEGKKVIVVFVPESSQVHSTAGKVFDRNEDGDFNITNNSELVTQIYLRKQKTYTENEVFPFVTIDDFKPELFDKVRALVRSQRPNHPWVSMSDDDLLNSAGLYKQDVQTGKSGYTLAAILLLGKDEIVLSALPHHKTDAILRRENLDRYDDRDDIRVNLLESYDRLMAFIAKHLPDKFHQEGDQRISLRDHIFREIIGNLLIHREFANAFPAKLIIEKERVITENWNKPHGHGNIDPANFTPYPKNPMIARFFKELGLVGELGSGIRKVFKFTPLYSFGAKPRFIEEDVFNTIIPLAGHTVKETALGESDGWENLKLKLGEKLGERLGEKLGENEWNILEHIHDQPTITIKELSQNIEISTTSIENNIAKLKTKGFLERIGSDREGYWKINS